MAITDIQTFSLKGDRYGDFQREYSSEGKVQRMRK